MDFRPAFAALAKRLEDDLLVEFVAAVTRKNLPLKAFKELPALVVLESGVAPIRDGDRMEPVAYRLTAALVLFVPTKADVTAPGDDVLVLTTAVGDALTWHEGEPPAWDGYATTLGGVVRRAWIEDARISDDVENVSVVTIDLEVVMEIEAG